MWSFLLFRFRRLLLQEEGTGRNGVVERNVGVVTGVVKVLVRREELVMLVEGGKSKIVMVKSQMVKL